MNEIEFLDAIGKIDNDLFEEADIDIDRKPLKKSKTSSKKFFIAASAAAAVFIIGTAVFLIPKDNPDIINNNSSLVLQNTVTTTTELNNAASENEDKSKDKAVTSVYKDNSGDKNDINSSDNNAHNKKTSQENPSQANSITGLENVVSSNLPPSVTTQKNQTANPGTETNTHAAQQDYPATHNTKNNTVNFSEDCSFVEFGNKTISYKLKNALDNFPKEKVIDIIARPYIDYNFIYNGKTLNDYYTDLYEERMLPEKLGQLIKEGDSLKYGTKLYEEGTPDGEKWIKELYDERINFYGKDFLDKYIVNGEFLRDKVYNDMEGMKDVKKAYDANQEALNVYYKYLAENPIPMEAGDILFVVIHVIKYPIKQKGC